MSAFGATAESSSSNSTGVGRGSSKNNKNSNSDDDDLLSGLLTQSLYGGQQQSQFRRAAAPDSRVMMQVSGLDSNKVAGLGSSFEDPNSDTGFIPSISRVQVENRWTVGAACKWHLPLPFLIGCNYIVSSAINQIEMWSSDTFDIVTIEREMDLASSLGFNVLRVYLHDLVWLHDQEGLIARMHVFLDAAVRRSIKVIFVLFDDCHRHNPVYGPQNKPLQGVHNSGWVMSPGRKEVCNIASLYDGSKKSRSQTAGPTALVERLKHYVVGILTAFTNDHRVLMWDIYNEPGQNELGNTSNSLLMLTWQWALGVRPSQPLTATTDGSIGPKNTKLNESYSDILSFHCYSHNKFLKELIASHRKKANGRPIICTEYMARENNSLFTNCIPVFHKCNVGCLNWGLVAGKTQTIYNWQTVPTPREIEKMVTEQKFCDFPKDVMVEPKLWFHDIYRYDGGRYQPYDLSEVEFIKSFTYKVGTKGFKDLAFAPASAPVPVVESAKAANSNHSSNSNSSSSSSSYIDSSSNSSSNIDSSSNSSSRSSNIMQGQDNKEKKREKIAVFSELAVGEVVKGSSGIIIQNSFAPPANAMSPGRVATKIEIPTEPTTSVFFSAVSTAGTFPAGIPTSTATVAKLGGIGYYIFGTGKFGGTQGCWGQCIQETEDKFILSSGVVASKMTENFKWSWCDARGYLLSDPSKDISNNSSGGPKSGILISTPSSITVTEHSSNMPSQLTSILSSSTSPNIGIVGSAVTIGTRPDAVPSLLTGGSFINTKTTSTSTSSSSSTNTASDAEKFDAVVNKLLAFKSRSSGI